MPCFHEAENKKQRIENQLAEVVQELEEHRSRQDDNLDDIHDDIKYHEKLLNKVGSDTADTAVICERIQTLRRELREERRRRFKDLTREKRELEREAEKVTDAKFL
jgi:septal ring factor EnvC (AmiA/AmiB activator)